MARLCKNCVRFKSYNTGAKGRTFTKDYCSGKEPHLPPNRCPQFKEAE